MTVAVIMYKRLGISNTEIALYTSWLYLPWVIKPFWSPLVDLFRTKRWWIVAMQLVIGAGLAGVALTIPVPGFLQYTLAFLWLMAFSSATHDIAADGFYMLGLSSHEQAWFVGIRSTFYRLAMISGQGLLVMFAGALEAHYGLPEVVVTVQAVAEESSPASFDPGGFAPPATVDEQQVFTSSKEYQLTLADRDAAEVALLVESVKNWNIEQGFYEPEVAAEQDEKEKTGLAERLGRRNCPLVRPYLQGRTKNGLGR